MSNSKSGPFFFKDKPLFGLDIGHRTLRVMQLEPTRGKPRLKGYGSIAFDPSAVEDGVIVKPELIAKPANKLFRQHLIGDISTKRVAVALPASRAFARTAHFPNMSSADMLEAVRTEAEQNIPAPIDELFLDYSIRRSDENGCEVFVVGIRQDIVNSYLLLTRLLGLEAIMLETTIGASAELFALDKQSDIPTVLVDFGGKDTDITIFNKGLVVTGTVAFGGDDVTEIIQKTLNVPEDEAVVLKSKYGLGQHNKIQRMINKSLEPSLQQLLKEIRRTIRYYEERYPNEEPIGQVMVMGGGSNIPGLSEYLTGLLKLPTRPFDPGAHINFEHLKPFYDADRLSYVAVAGLAVTNPRKVFA